MASSNSDKKQIDPNKLKDADVRQKLVSVGAASLSDAELLSLIIRDGSNGTSAIELASDLLSNYGNNLTELGLAEIPKLRMFKNMGIGRAAVVAAAMELAKRRKVDEAVTIECINNNDDVISIFKPIIGELNYEEFWVTYLGTSNRILDKIKIGQGGSNGLVVDNRLIIKRALDKFAVSMILVHNHPSGSPEPGNSDRMLTDKLVEAASFFDIRVLDHIIITSGSCLSFRAEGYL